MDFPSHSRNKLALAIMAASAAPLAQADFDETLADAGPELEVAQQDITGPGMNPDMAQDAEGNFILVWDEADSDNDDNFAVMAQRFEADGTPRDDSPLTVATGGTDEHYINPTVDMNENGKAVFAWRVDTNPGSYTCSGFLMKSSLKLGEDSASSATEVIENSTVDDDYCKPDIAVNAQGDFVIAWQVEESLPPSVEAHVFDAATGDARTSSPIELADNNNSIQENPAVAINEQRFLAAWESNHKLPSQMRAYARLFSTADGQPVSNQATEGAQGNEEFRLDNGAMENGTSTAQIEPALAMDEDGDFMGIWTEYDPTETPEEYGVRAQIFEPAAAVVNEGIFFTTFDQEPTEANTAVSVMGENAFAFAWSKSDWDSDNGRNESTLKAQALDASGIEVLDAPVNVASETPTVGRIPKLGGFAVNEAGDVAASWRNNVSPDSYVMARAAEGSSPETEDPDQGGDASDESRDESRDEASSDDDDDFLGGTGPLGLIGGVLLLAWRRLVRRA